MTTAKPSAAKRSRSRWFGDRLSFREVAQLSSKAEQLDELARRLDDMERQERAKADPCGYLLADIARQRRQFKAASAAAKKRAPTVLRRPTS
jgi:hypothetical protein